MAPSVADASSKISTTDPAILRKAIAEHSHALPWFADDIPDYILTPRVRHVLEDYAGVPPDQVVTHIKTLQSKAFDIMFPYPCIGTFAFLRESLRTSARYADILERLKNGGRLLDMACCVGQELRFLLADGAPGSALYGAELEPTFIELGHELFCDAGRFPGTFITPVDVFNPPPAFVALEGTMDVVHLGWFLHLFDWDGQLRAACQIARMLKDEKGVLVLGRQLGSRQAGEYRHDMYGTETQRMYQHDQASFQQLWDEVGKEVGGVWRTTSEFKKIEGSSSWAKWWTSKNSEATEFEDLVFAVERAG